MQPHLITYGITCPNWYGTVFNILLDTSYENCSDDIAARDENLWRMCISFLIDLLY